MVGVDVAVDGADFAAEHALERDRHRVEDGDVEAALASGSGDLGADPAGADHDDPPAAVQPLAQRVGVLDAAQVEHAVELSAGNRKAPRLGSGSQQQPVVAEPLTVVERELARGRVQTDRGGAEAQVDVVRGVEALVVDVDLLAPGLAAQVLLGQRRPLVRALRFAADQHQAPFEALASQRLGRLGAGEAGADDHECLVTGHGTSSCVSARNSWRVRASSRIRPCSAEVTVLAPNF